MALGGINLKITHTRVYDLEESIVASGLPMQSNYDEEIFDKAVRSLRLYTYYKESGDMGFATESDLMAGKKHFDRALKLSNVPSLSGHNCFEKGIVVNCNITADQSFWQQFHRYHFQDTISSQSKQHRLIKMDLHKLRGNVSDVIINELEEMISVYANNEGELIIWNNRKYSKKEFFELIIKSSPVGLELTARVTFNYLQLKSMLKQRKNHKMSDWNTDFVNWINTLPFAEELIVSGVDK